MSDSKRDIVDHWSFVEGVKNPLGRLADACIEAYEENGDPLLREAANALRAVETVDLSGCKSESAPLPWLFSEGIDYPMRNSAYEGMLYMGHGSKNRIGTKTCYSIVDCMNTVYALQTKTGGK